MNILDIVWLLLCLYTICKIFGIVKLIALISSIWHDVFSFKIIQNWKCIYNAALKLNSSNYILFFVLLLSKMTFTNFQHIRIQETIINRDTPCIITITNSIIYSITCFLLFVLATASFTRFIG